jgi:hypothetical protein
MAAAIGHVSPAETEQVSGKGYNLPGQFKDE